MDIVQLFIICLQCFALCLSLTLVSLKLSTRHLHFVTHLLLELPHQSVRLVNLLLQNGALTNHGLVAKLFISPLFNLLPQSLNLRLLISVQRSNIILKLVSDQ